MNHPSYLPPSLLPSLSFSLLPPSLPPPSLTSSEKVEALYNNIAEDADELSFNKGEILLVKEHINEEWLICSRGNQSGIVPVNYVKAIV